MLTVDFTPAFKRDTKRLCRKHVDLAPLMEVVDLVAQNTPEALDTLVRRHRMHTLHGEWAGARECHVANAGDWLCIWVSDDRHAVFQRTGSHSDLFG